MSNYNPPRTRNLFVTGMPYSFSRSRVANFMQCPRCFYLDRKRGVEAPSGLSLNMNNAVDTLLKREFDLYRKVKAVPPLLAQSGLNFIPYDHPDIDLWRDNFRGIKTFYRNYEFTGAVDDIWINGAGQLILADYKSTASDKPVVLLDKGYHIYYKQQAEFYQWILRRMGFPVLETAYFLYCTGDTTQPEFNSVIKFQVNLIPYEGNTDWVEPKLDELIACIEGEEIPGSSASCDFCKYYEARKRWFPS